MDRRVKYSEERKNLRVEDARMKEMEQRLQEEGLDPSASSNERLSMLWQIYQSSEGTVRVLSQQIQDLQKERRAEIEKVQQYISNIKSLTKTRDSVALHLEEENKSLHATLEEFNLQQEAQRSEIAEMLLQESLAEIIPMSLSEQVAYMLADRASLLEKAHHLEASDRKRRHHQDGEKEQMTMGHTENSVIMAAPHVSSPLKRLLGLRKAALSKQKVIDSSEDEQKGRMLQELERDVEEASARLSMAHEEIRRLTDELESAHLTQKAYEPELQENQLEVEHLRDEVEKLKHCEVAEMRKTREVNDKLKEELSHLQETIKTLQTERMHLLEENRDLSLRVEELESTERSYDKHLKEVHFLDEQVCHLKFLLQEKQKKSQQISTRLQTESQHTAALIESLKIQLQEKSEESNNQVEEVKKLQKILQNREQELHIQKRNNTDLQKNKIDAQQENVKLQQEVTDLKSTLSTKTQETEALSFELQEALVSVDAEKSKYSEKRMKQKNKLSRARHVYLRETSQRDDKIKDLEKETSILRKHQEKTSEMVMSFTRENQSLLEKNRELLLEVHDSEEVQKNMVQRLHNLDVRLHLLKEENCMLQQSKMQLSKPFSGLTTTAEKSSEEGTAEGRIIEGQDQTTLLT